MLPRDLTPTHPPTPISLVISLHLILGLARISHPGCLMTQTSAVSPPSPSPPCLSSSEIPARCVNCSPAGMNGQDPGQGHPAERSIRGTRPAGPAPSPSWTCAENRRPVPGSVTRPTYVFASEFSPWKAFPVAGSAAASPGSGFVVLEREKVPAPIPASDPPTMTQSRAGGLRLTEARRQRLTCSGLFSGAGHLEDGGSGRNAHLLGGRGAGISKPVPTSQCRQRFHEEAGGRAKGSREGAAKLSTRRRARSVPTSPVTVPCSSAWLGHPGFMVKGRQASFSREGRGRYLLKVVPRALAQACWPSTADVLLRGRTCGSSVKGVVGRVTIPHCCIPHCYTTARRLRPGVGGAVVLLAGQHGQAPLAPALLRASSQDGGRRTRDPRQAEWLPPWPAGALGLSPRPTDHPASEPVLAASLPMGPLGWQLGLCQVGRQKNEEPPPRSLHSSPPRSVRPGPSAWEPCPAHPRALRSCC